MKSNYYSLKIKKDKLHILKVSKKETKEEDMLLQLIALKHILMYLQIKLWLILKEKISLIKNYN